MTKRLYKSKNRMFFGVCGGIAEYFNIDPTIVRLLAVVITFAGGSGILAYIIGAIIIPERPLDEDGSFEENERPANDQDRSDDDFDKHFEK